MHGERIQQQDELIPHSCEHCKIIEIDGTKTGAYVNQVFEYSYSDVQTYSQNCELFKWALNLPYWDKNGPAHLALSISTDTEDLQTLDAEWHNCRRREETDDIDKASLHIFAKKGDASSQYIKSRPLTRSRDGKANMKRYRKRLKRCSGHSRCITTTQKSPPNLAPTRLLHIGMYQDMDVRLRIIKPENPLNYVALSYCWGDSQEKATTTKINIKARLKEVDWSQLPQTIKDAVKVTQSLGFTYLWVDALCIIQDDKQDVATELAKMSSIYQGASLTISAASAKHSSEGFLGDRVLSKAYGDALFRLPYRHGKGGNIVKGEVLLSKQPIRDTFEDPIDQRAWTWQEHILSRRLLRFGSRQTTWKCQNSHCSIDGGGLPQPVNKDVQFAIDKIHESKEVQLKMNEFGQLGHSIVLSNWNIQIEEYSRRTITDLNDKIPACAALAENFAGIMRLSAADYLAGLWKNDIEAQLLWHRPDNSGVSNSRRSQNPTWSWASLDGPVTFFQRSLLETSGRIIDAQAKLEGYEITREVKSLSYSEVSSDHLRLRGRLQQAHWDGFDLRQSTGSFEVIDLRIYWDSSISNCHRDVWCFEVFGSTYSLGLILKKIPKGFERLGFFQVDSQSSCTAVKSWFREVEKEQIFLY